MLITPAYAQAASGGNALFELLFPLLMVNPIHNPSLHMRRLDGSVKVCPYISLHVQFHKI